MLSNRWIVLCALIVLIAVLTVIGLSIDQPSLEMQQARISELALDDIDRIEIQSGDMQLRLNRAEEAWTIELPINWPAHASNVKRLLSIVNSEAAPLADAADVDLGALGLEQPVASLRFNDTDLRFGASNNIGERRYLMIDHQIYLLPDIHLAFIAQGLPGVVDRQLLPRRYQIESIGLPELKIQRNADDQWRTLPASEYSQAQLQQLIDNWQELQASRIKPLDLGGSVPQLIEVELSDGQSIDFLLISFEPELIIANSQIGLQYHFLRDYADQLITIRDSANAN